MEGEGNGGLEKLQSIVEFCYLNVTFLIECNLKMQVVLVPGVFGHLSGFLTEESLFNLAQVNRAMKKSISGLPIARELASQVAAATGDEKQTEFTNLLRDRITLMSTFKKFDRYLPIKANLSASTLKEALDGLKKYYTGSISHLSDGDFCNWNSALLSCYPPLIGKCFINLYDSHYRQQALPSAKRLNKKWAIKKLSSSPVLADQPNHQETALLKSCSLRKGMLFRALAVLVVAFLTLFPR